MVKETTITVHEIKQVVRQDKQWLEIKHSVEGSDKIYTYKYLAKRGFNTIPEWNNEEIHQFLKKVGALDLMGERTHVLNIGKIKVRVDMWQNSQINIQLGSVNYVNAW